MPLSLSLSLSLSLYYVIVSTVRVRVLVVGGGRREKSFGFASLFVFVLCNNFHCSCLSVGGLRREKRKVIKTFLLLYADKSQTDIQFVCKKNSFEVGPLYMEKDATHDDFSSPFSKMTKQSKSLGFNFGRKTIYLRKEGKG